MNVLLLSLVLAMAPPAADAGAAASGTPQTPQVAQKLPAAYVLGPDDAIGIRVFNADKLNAEAIVPPDGRISLELIGAVIIAGKTTDQVAAELQTKWSVYYRNISVNVILVKKRALDSVSIYGYAARNGNIEYRRNMHILDLIASVGGGGPEGNLSRTVVTHRDGRSETLDLSDPETKGNSPANILLAEGDLVFVPQKHDDEVSVLGKVEKPGAVAFKEHMNVLDAMQEAGGIHLEDADIANTTLTRAGQKRTIDLDAIMNHSNTELNIPLMPGDTLFVPELKNRIYVFGQVGRAGWFNFKPGNRMLDALKEMGGHSANADLKHVKIIEVDEKKDISKVTTVDVESYFERGNTKGNPLLKPGVVIYLPEKKKSHSFNPLQILEFLNIARLGQTVLGL